ncbi:MAG TPA: glycosyltransferase family 4 protein [Bacteroidales bacterium]|nr:glycosyltransferase family 4 protein [Bacteroidales bacterium]
MPHRILIISPTPTHPVNAGNRSRIFVYSKYLIELGHEVHFLYSDQEDADITAMEQYWGNRFHHVSYKAPVRQEFNKYLKKFNSNYQYYSHIDDHYNELLDARIAELKKQYDFSAVIIEYIFNTKAFFNFGNDVIKVVDTHDVMTDRHKHFLRAGKPAVWYSTPKREEKKGIDRADYVMAIQDKEAAFYRKITRKKVITVGHIVNVAVPESREVPRPRLLFVGSNNPNNFHAITDFLRDYFPLLRTHYPGLECYMAGKICQAFEDTEGLVKLGEVADLADAYRESDLVFNPLTIGTGLKIKMIEALGQGKPVISTTVGAEGLEEGEGKAFLIADTPEQFSRQLGRLLNEPGCYPAMVKNALEFVRNYNIKHSNELIRLFNRD